MSFFDIFKNKAQQKSIPEVLNTAAHYLSDEYKNFKSLIQTLRKYNKLSRQITAVYGTVQVRQFNAEMKYIFLHSKEPKKEIKLFLNNFEQIFIDLKQKIELELSQIYNIKFPAILE